MHVIGTEMLVLIDSVSDHVHHVRFGQLPDELRFDRRAKGLLGASSSSDHDHSEHPMRRPPEAADRAVADPAAVLDGRRTALRK
jgi:hypothetical protein